MSIGMRIDVSKKTPKPPLQVPLREEHLDRPEWANGELARLYRRWLTDADGTRVLIHKLRLITERQDACKRVLNDARMNADENTDFGALAAAECGARILEERLASLGVESGRAQNSVRFARNRFDAAWERFLLLRRALTDDAADPLPDAIGREMTEDALRAELVALCGTDGRAK